MQRIDPLSLLTSDLKLVLAPLLKVEHVDASQLRAYCNSAPVVAEGDGRELMSRRDGLNVAATSDIKELYLAIEATTCEKQVVHWREGETSAAAAWVSIKLGFLRPEYG